MSGAVNEPAEAIEAADFAPGAPPVSFWRRPWVQSVLPWLSSLGVHVGIVVVALVLLASGAFQDLLPRLTQPQVVVPTTVLAQTNIGGVPNVGNMDDVTSQNAQLDPVQKSDNPLPEGAGANLEALSEPGGRDQSASITGITGMGSLSEALGGGGGGQGSTVFGEPGGGGRFMGFDLGTAGDGGNVTRVVFVCDASGSMEGRPRTLLINELKKAVGPLEPIQFFNVVFFQFDDYAAAFRDRLRPASPRYKKETEAFLDGFTMKGGTNPLPALEAAFKMKPQLVFLLTDGRFDEPVGYDEIVRRIAELNADKGAVVNTIMFINRDETAEGVLRRIASENGGEFKYVGEDDL